MMRVKIQPRLNVFCSLQPSTTANGDKRRNGSAGRKDPFRFKGLCMKVRRFVASALAALLLVVAVDAGAGAAFAQIQQRQTTGKGRPPVAAPTGAGAESAPLAAPAGDVQAQLVGPQSETADTFTPHGSVWVSMMRCSSVLISSRLANRSSNCP